MDDFGCVCVRAFSEEEEGSGGFRIVVNEMFVDHLNKRRWWRADTRGDGLVDGFEEVVEKYGWKFGLLAFVTNLKLKILKALCCLWRRPSVQMALTCRHGRP